MMPVEGASTWGPAGWRALAETSRRSSAWGWSATSRTGNSWGGCRRILRNPHDAEDAFQATFLVLARKAASIAHREMVANWLYAVAYKTAVRAESLARRRRAREHQV